MPCRPLTLALACLATALSSLAAAAQDADPGATLFARYCATCHGADGQGRGPMAPVLLVQPKDLTALAAEAENGAFPVRRVVARIDGRDPLVSHGSAMPVYGDFFEGPPVRIEAPEGGIDSTQPVADLVAYLRAMQDG